MNNIRLSIITVTFNDADRLRASISSIFEQVDQEFEYLIIDGNSKDSTKELVRDLQQKRATVFLSEPDKGIFDAMNKGLALAKGHYVLFLNAGDLLSGQQATQRINEKLSDDSIDAIYGDVIVMDVERGVRTKRAHHLNVIYRGLPSSHQAIILRRACCIQFPFSLDIKLAADFHMALRIYNAGYKKWVYCDTPFSKITTGGISDIKRWDVRLEFLKILFSSGTMGQILLGGVHQSKMILMDLVSKVLKRLLGRKRFNKLTSWRWNS